MSDLGRKDLGEKAKETIKPESEKSSIEKASESVSTTADKAIAAVQPDDTKSATQRLGDSTTSNTDKAHAHGKSVVEGTTEKVEAGLNTGVESGKSAAHTASDTITGAVDKTKAEGQEKSGNQSVVNTATQALNTAAKAVSDAAKSVAGDPKTSK